ncbi:MAG: LysR family transcriptional regulator [Novosphingobium sp.]|nr:LysR family transcriptional regulator [Novosphingobium sp.]MCP5403822.1 LysR family transcriptional regulator [Novosphingobium sp.]
MPELKAVSTAARLGSLSRAANVLHITQPALSRRIAEAEKSVGVVLFERLPRGVKATEACLAFLRHAEIALTSIDEGIDAALQMQSDKVHSLSIGLLEVLCDDTLTKCCREVLTSFVGSSISFSVSSWSSDISADLTSGKIKLGLRYRKDSSPQLESIWIADDPVIVVCASSHPLAKNSEVTVEELEQVQWVGAPMAIDRTSDNYDEGLRFLGFEGWKTMEVSTIHARTKLSEAGFGVALIRRACVVDQLEAGSLVELSTPLSLSIPIFLAWRRGAYLGRMADKLISELRGAYTNARL